MSLRDTAMTTTLTISRWHGQRIDRQTTSEVVLQKGTSKDAVRVEKYLVPPKALEKIKKAETSARQTFKRLSLPWGESARIISAETFFDFTNAMRAEHSAFDAAVVEFLGSYPQLQLDAPQRLNGLYDPSDFPSVAELRTKFGMHYDIMPVPDKADFRVQLGEDVEEEIRTNIEQTVRSRFHEAQRELWDRLESTLRHFATTMRAEDKIFRNSTVTNLAEIARLAPKLTLEPNPQLEDACAEILRMVNRTDPATLRDNPDVRSATASEAERALAHIENAMAGVFGQAA